MPRAGAGHPPRSAAKLPLRTTLLTGCSQARGGLCLPGYSHRSAQTRGPSRCVPHRAVTLLRAVCREQLSCVGGRGILKQLQEAPPQN